MMLIVLSVADFVATFLADLNVTVYNMLIFLTLCIVVVYYKII